MNTENESSFDAFITVDKNLPYQQNLSNLALAVVVLERIQMSFPPCYRWFLNWSRRLRRSPHAPMSKLGHNNTVEQDVRRNSARCSP
jgi:hypothetical protein